MENSGKQEPEGSSAYVEREKLIWGLPRLVASFVVVVLAIAVAYQVLTIDIELKFDFPAFLSLLLAFFAVGLSAMFYFKATETSNAFHDNTHKFTREVSQILDSIEAGFAQRLRHPDEGYTGSMDGFDKIPFDVTEAREKVVVEEREVAKKQAAYQGMIDELAERAKLTDTEKTDLLGELNRAQEELGESKNELRRLQRRIQSEEENQEVDQSVTAKRLWDAVRRVLERAYGDALNARSSSETISNLLRVSLSSRYVRQMRDVGIFGPDGELTELGAESCRHILRMIRSER